MSQFGFNHDSAAVDLSSEYAAAAHLCVCVCELAPILDARFLYARSGGFAAPHPTTVPDHTRALRSAPARVQYAFRRDFPLDDHLRAEFGRTWKSTDHDQPKERHGDGSGEAGRETWKDPFRDVGGPRLERRARLHRRERDRGRPVRVDRQKGGELAKKT